MHYEGEVIETPLDSFSGVSGLSGVAVLAPAQGLVEFFPSDGQTLVGLGAVAIEAVASGWQVAVIAPAERMGEAHRSLRGLPLHLQCWWADGDHIRFGGPEVP
jgi:hypothetical protein